MLEFERDPFYLFPIREGMLDVLFLDREEELSMAKGVLSMKYKDSQEICVILGGTGVGKSSILYNINRMAGELGHKTIFHANPEEFVRKTGEIESNVGVVIIDDIGKANNDLALRTYRAIEEHVSGTGGIVFFSDIYDRDKDTIKTRNFTVSQNISLPKSLSADRLSFFLEERMKRCLAKGEEYQFPFERAAVDMAATRSSGNLRNFLGYIKNAWLAAYGYEKDSVEVKDMQSSVVTMDRALLGSCDLVDLRILWYATSGETNKNFLAHQCGIDTKTMETRINGMLSDLIIQRRSGKEILVSTVYKYIKNGQYVLERIFEGLGIQITEITGCDR